MEIELSQIKSVIGIIAIGLTFAGYFPYIRDIIRGTTQPHIYSWFLWTVVGTVAFSLQYSDGGGVGTFVTLAAVVMCATVFLLSLIRKSQKHITKSDTIFFILTIIAIALWLFAKQPVLSAILITIVDFLCFVPTIRKSWYRPDTETPSFYLINTLRFFLAVVSLQRYTIITALYPGVWFVGNGLFALMLRVRRNQLASTFETNN